MSPQKKKEEEGGTKFKCNYSGHGKPAIEVFDDKNLELLKQNRWGGGGKKLPKNWAQREKTYNELMKVMGQKVQRHLLAGREGGTAGSRVEPVCEEDDRVENQNQDDVERGGGEGEDYTV